ncbi:MAG TPA: PAS domain-containing protein, partial [Thermoleophilaceae bacterium]|nr:PAS domain-containing protein [Thermoleophilaceae bacterium]
MRMHPESEQASSIRPERDGELNPEQIGTFERLSRTLVGSMPDLGVLVAGRDMRVAVMDGPIFSSAGIAAEDAVGLPLDALMTPRSAALLLPQWSAALSGSHRTLDYCSDDAHRSYSVGFGPLEDSSGEVVAAMAVIRDLTEQVTPLR